MIQPLRTAHRRAFLALALVLPAIVLVGLASRHPLRRIDSPASPLPASAHLLKTSASLWQKSAFQTEFFDDAEHPGALFVVLHPLSPQTETTEPDLLLYWSADQPQGNSLPANARLLGALIAGKAFTLSMDGRTGYLVLFSLPHEAVFDMARVEALP